MYKSVNELIEQLKALLVVEGNRTIYAQHRGQMSKKELGCGGSVFYSLGSSTTNVAEALDVLNEVDGNEHFHCHSDASLTWRLVLDASNGEPIELLHSDQVHDTNKFLRILLAADKSAAMGQSLNDGLFYVTATPIGNSFHIGTMDTILGEAPCVYSSQQEAQETACSLKQDAEQEVEVLQLKWNYYCRNAALCASDSSKVVAIGDIFDMAGMNY
ncbi:hypothetical protein [Enterovibrio norvegicus]|uniref:hypothetical protein n=1 Tax=Enterovibrio norvegicus TaxID=188144 RepID=UPI00352D7574